MNAHLSKAADIGIGGKNSAEEDDDDDSQSAEAENREHLSEAAQVGQADAHVAGSLELNEIMDVEAKDSDDVKIRGQVDSEDSSLMEKNVQKADDIYKEIASILFSENENHLKKKEFVERIEKEKKRINCEPDADNNVAKFEPGSGKQDDCEPNLPKKMVHEHHAEKIVHTKELEDLPGMKVSNKDRREKYDKGLEVAIKMLERRIEEAKMKEERERELEMERRREEEEKREYQELLLLLRKVLTES